MMGTVQRFGDRGCGLLVPVEQLDDSCPGWRKLGDGLEKKMERFFVYAQIAWIKAGLWFCITRGMFS